MGILYVAAALLVTSRLIRSLVWLVAVRLSNSWRVSARPNIVSIDEHELPPSVAYYFRSVETSLDALGFEPVAYLRIDRSANSISSLVLCLCNHDTMDGARCRHAV
jgi:hypothetical protein